MSRSLEAVERRATEIIRSGTAGELQQLLHEHPALAHARIGDDSGHTRSLLHVVTDWPAAP